MSANSLPPANRQPSSSSSPSDMEAPTIIANKLFISIKHFLGISCPNSLPPANRQPSSSSSPSDIEAPTIIADDHDQHHQSGIVPDAHNVVEWPTKVIGFGLSWAAGIALLSLQNHRPLPLSFHFATHAIVIALALIFVSKFMYPKYPKPALVVEDVGVIFGVTAYFFLVVDRSKRGVLKATLLSGEEVCKSGTAERQ